MNYCIIVEDDGVETVLGPYGTFKEARSIREELQTADPLILSRIKALFLHLDKHPTLKQRRLPRRLPRVAT